jgi:hypothetical protein
MLMDVSVDSILEIAGVSILVLALMVLKSRFCTVGLLIS